MSKEFMNKDLEHKLELMKNMGFEGVLIFTNILFEVIFENLPDHVIQTLMDKHLEKISKIGKDELGDGE